MKSYINALADFRSAPFEKEVVIKCPDEYIDGQLKHLTRSGKKNEPASVLEKGDVAVLSLESELAKFNRPSVFITVGGGLFDKEFEETLIGRSVNETFETEKDGKAVKVTVKQAMRTVFPEPTDEMAKAYAESHDGFEGIKTVGDYCEKVKTDYIEDKRREIFYGVQDEIVQYVLTHSDWEFDEEELNTFISEEKSYINEELKAEEETLETVSAEKLRTMFGVESLEEFETFIKNAAEQQVAMTLWLAAVNGVDPKDVEFGGDDERLNWDFLENYVKENLKITEEK